MGCNMYAYAEVWDSSNLAWQFVSNAVQAGPGWNRTEQDGIYGGRRNIVFAQLAGVRNDEEVVPLINVSERKGLPGDVTFEVEFFKDMLPPDNRITTWITLEELERFNWEDFAIEWEETAFSRETMSLLRRLAEERTPDQVRMIFWFDDEYDIV